MGALRTAVQKDPVVVGKPETIIMNGALELTGLTADQVVMVGDNYNTDIRAGLNAGIDTLLVYTGVSTKEQVAQEAQQPTHEVDSLDDWDI